MFHNRQSLEGARKSSETRLAWSTPPTVSSWLQGSKCTSRQKSRLKCGQKVLPWFLGNQQDVRFLGDRGHPDISWPSLKKLCIFAPMPSVTSVCTVRVQYGSIMNLQGVQSKECHNLVTEFRNSSPLAAEASITCGSLSAGRIMKHRSATVPKPRQRLLIRHLQPMCWKQLAGCKTDDLTVLSVGKQTDALSSDNISPIWKFVEKSEENKTCRSVNQPPPTTTSPRCYSYDHLCYNNWPTSWPENLPAARGWQIQMPGLRERRGCRACEVHLALNDAETASMTVARSARSSGLVKTE